MIPSRFRRATPGFLVSLAAALAVTFPVSAQQPAPPSAAAVYWADVMRNLHDRRADNRVKALQALNLAGYTAAADDVAALIADPDSNVRYAALDAELTFFLSEPIGVAASNDKAPSRSRAQEAFDAGPLVRNAAVVPASVIDALMKALIDPAPRIRFDALHVLGVIAEPPLNDADAETLASGLDSADATTRIATARVLGRLKVARAGDKLIAALNDDNKIEQKYATEALGLTKNERAVTSLLERLDFFKSGDLAAETLLALGRIASPSARDALRARLNDSDAAMRAAALEGLGRLQDADSGSAFVAHRQKDNAAAVRLAATFAVAKLGDPDVSALVRGLSSAETYAQAVDYLLELGPAAAPGVKAALDTTRDSALRAELIHVLGFIGTKDTVPAIEPLLKDHNDHVAHAATDAIARLSR
jgi:HEAT repeat protein